MITQFSTIQRFGLYVNFTWPSALAKFSRYNIIYGWNGSGKSTLARVFKSLESRTPLDDGSQIKVATSANEYCQDAFGTFDIPVRVFDRAYVEETVFPTTGYARPIYVVGKENADRVRRLNLLRANLAEAQSAHLAALKDKDDAIRSLDEFCTNRARDIKERGWKDYHAYDRTRFRKRSESLAAEGCIATVLLDDETRDRLDAEQHQRQPVSMSPEEVPKNTPRQMHDLLTTLLGHSVVATVIESLCGSPNLSQWCRDGLSLHQTSRTEECLFCGNTIPRSRLTNLEMHFNDEYQRAICALEAFANDLVATADSLVKPSAFQIDHAYDDMRKDFEEATCLLAEEKRLNAEYCRQALKAIEDKKSNMFASVASPEPPCRGLEDALATFNSLVATHNSRGSSHDLHATDCRRRLESHLVAVYLPAYIALKDASFGCVASLALRSQKIQDLIDEIACLEVEIRNHRLPAEKINSDLGVYLGHADLHLEVSDTGYVISRNGVAAENLSEGEKTAISLLYFLHSLDSESFSKREGVVVLDDPVTSLDNNALFCACSFVVERTAGVRQLFILTHNLFFLQQARKSLRSISNRAGCGGELNQYMTEVQGRVGKRESNLRRLDSSLGGFGSEYEFLFSLIYRASSDSTEFETQYVSLLPNVARRVIEAFFAFRRPGDDNLEECVRSTGADEALKLRLYRFVSSLSHQKRIEEGDCSFTTDAEVVLRIRDVLDLIKHEDPRHFDAMVVRAGAPRR